MDDRSRSLRGRRLARRAAGVVVIAALAAAPAAGQEGLRPPQAAVRDLIGDDWRASKAAAAEVERIGARAVVPLLEARAAAGVLATRRGPIDQALAGVVSLLADDVLRPVLDSAERIATIGALGGALGAVSAVQDLPDPSVPAVSTDDLGDLGSIEAPPPQGWASKRERARRARGALVALGPAVAGPLLAEPPVRDPAQREALVAVVRAIYQAERVLAAEAHGAGLEGFRARYRGVADLATPIVAAGVRDEDASVRAAFRAVREDALLDLLAALDAPSAAARDAAEAALYRLGDLARPALEQASDRADGSPHLRQAAARLARRIRFGVSPALYLKLGHDFEGYADLPFRERRRRVVELERLGGPDAVPALRAILREEASLEVQTMAAVGLFRLGDPAGADWLTLHRSGLTLVRLSKRELAAIYMDQGLKQLNLGRFEQAEAEFKRVLEVEPTNEVALYNLACTYSRWGKIDQALSLLEQAVERGFDDADHMRKDPDLAPLHGLPRYEQLLERLEQAAAGQGPPAGQGPDEPDAPDEPDGPAPEEPDEPDPEEAP